MKLREAKLIEQFINDMVNYYQHITPEDDIDWMYFWDYVNLKLGTFSQNTGITVDPFWMRSCISQDILKLEFGDRDYGDLTL